MPDFLTLVAAIVFGNLLTATFLWAVISMDRADKSGDPRKIRDHAKVLMFAAIGFAALVGYPLYSALGK